MANFWFVEDKLGNCSRRLLLKLIVSKWVKLVNKLLSIVFNWLWARLRCLMLTNKLICIGNDVRWFDVKVNVDKWVNFEISSGSCSINEHWLISRKFNCERVQMVESSSFLCWKCFVNLSPDKINS